MSKSYDNTIPLFAPPERQARLVRRVVTDSRRPQDPKDPDTCTLVALLDAFADPARRPGGPRPLPRPAASATARSRPCSPTQLHATLAPLRDRYEALLADPARLDAALAGGRAARQPSAPAGPCACCPPPWACERRVRPASRDPGSAGARPGRGVRPRCAGG